MNKKQKKLLQQVGTKNPAFGPVICLEPVLNKIFQ